MRWTIHKFGGSSLADADCIAHVAALLIGRQQDEGQAVVVSAMAGVTNALLELAQRASRGESGWPMQLQELRQRHLQAAADLVQQPALRGRLLEQLDQRFVTLEQLLASLALMGSAPTEALELISGFGELLSAELLSACLQQSGEPAVFVDAREVLRTKPATLMVTVDWEASGELLTALMSQHAARRYIITGFICRTVEGRISTLGRNGSDYSGSIFGRLLKADEIHIWTNVDGLLSADPGAVPQAELLDHLSYREAFELAYFGARVIHPQALSPAQDCDIPVFIRNTFNPDCPGTRIDSAGHPEPPVKGISGVGQMALINIEGAGMIGVPGTAERIFGALHQAAISVSMISQGSSEHSICVVVPGAAGEQARGILEQAFERELRHGQIHRVSLLTDIRILAIVGEGMTGRPGIAARLFGSLARAGINVRAIAQGASERNISVVIDELDAERALKAIHAGFYLSDQTISIGLIGPGHVGSALIRQILDATDRLKREANLDLRLRGIATSSRMRLSESGLEPDEAAHPLGDQHQPLDLERFVNHVHDDHVPHAVIIDCTASGHVAEHYLRWLQRGIHVITPNKQAGSGDLERYRALKQTLEFSSARWRYEATVGAGLPVIQTLRDLVDTGDRVLAIEGIFSGTLAYLFNRYAPGMSFAELVREARAAGYTEPDPRDDLSGMDVARKLVILAREMGLELGLEQIEVESLAPAALDGLGVDDFLQRLAEHDDVMARRLASAADSGQVLRYVAALNADGKASVTLQSLAGDHPFANLALTDNVVAFRTERYRDNPLIVQGPGAGPDVTAGGVFADLLRVAAGLGARL
ncbi:MAG: bifunctional aspartate kinase/homoserine dehydrogenase I [Wenzhouxiangella sp.]